MRFNLNNFIKISFFAGLTLFLFFVFYNFLSGLYNSVGAQATECSDNIDNDGDGGIDALIELNPNNGETFKLPVSSDRSPFQILGFVIEATGGDENNFYCPYSGNVSEAAMQADSITLDRICQLAGYDRVKTQDCHWGSSNRCNFDSGEDNCLWYWDDSSQNFKYLRADNGSGWVSYLVCEGRLAQCRDGKDNDNDGFIDMNDSGCDNPNDDSEIPHDSDCSEPLDDSEENINLAQVETFDVINVSESSALIRGRILDLGGADSSNVWFQWGRTISYGNETPHWLVDRPQMFGRTLVGLLPNTVYHFRAVAENNVGIVYGTDKTFTTLDFSSIAPTADLKANNSDGPITLAYQDYLTLSWTSSDAVSCQAEGDWSGLKPTSGLEIIQLLSVKTYTFTLECRNSANQTVQDSVQVIVNPKPPVVITKPAVTTL